MVFLSIMLASTRTWKVFGTSGGVGAIVPGAAVKDSKTFINQTTLEDLTNAIALRAFSCSVLNYVDIYR